jgi:L,D-transpeptidase catalytic domain
MTAKKIALYCTIAAVSIAALAAAPSTPADARSRYYEDEEDTPVTRGTPLLAIVGLSEQRVTIYSATGKMMESPVSSGQTGLETPAGIYSVVQKEEDHHSNIYDDARMPYMERITWTGIALHGGVLPGHPASHGCVRMPESFAERLYQHTRLGMRVLIVREDIAPAAFPQPAMFSRAAGVINASIGTPIELRLRDALRTKLAESEAAKRREKEARQAAAKKAADAAQAAKAQQAADARLEKAEAELKALEEAVAKAGEAEKAGAEQARAEAQAKIEAVREQASKARKDAQSKSEDAARANGEVKTASAATALAADAAEEAELNLSPVSVFVSRKTQRFYVRKNNKPVYEGPVTIREADKPIGSYVFTALEETGTPGELRWNLVSMYKNLEAGVEPPAPPAKGKSKARAEPAPANAAGAEAALARIVIPVEATARISQVVLPGSSLIISDEGPSVETGKDTDFVVVMSGEPQGGLAIRHHQTAGRRHDEFFGFFGNSFFGRPSDTRESRGRTYYSRPTGGFHFFGE